jgi:glycosyltransferase involved in cell wall biosynthesis
MSTPEVSLVLATRNRAVQLSRCLMSMAELRSQRPWEMIVVDNGSTDGTPDVIEQFRPQFNLFVSVVEPRPGHGYAKNAGLAAARGNIVIFTDDDCYPTATFVDDVCAEFDAHPEVSVLGGRILLFDPNDLPITLLVDPDPVMFPPRSYVRAGSVQGANFSFRRQHLLDVGGFDVRMGAGTPFASDDIDAVAQMLWAGHAGRYSPVPTVYHHHGRRTQAEGDQLWEIYDVGRGAYLAKFLARKDARWTYLKAVIRSVAAAIVKERSLQRPRRELAGARKWRKALG